MTMTTIERLRELAQYKSPHVDEVDFIIRVLPALLDVAEAAQKFRPWLEAQECEYMRDASLGSPAKELDAALARLEMTDINAARERLEKEMDDGLPIALYEAIRIILADHARLSEQNIPCPKCGQHDHGQTGEYPCNEVKP